MSYERRHFLADTFDGKNFQKKEWKKKSNTDTMIVSRVPPQNIDAENRCWAP